MYINNEDFETWMQKLSKKLTDIGQDLKSLINTKEVFDEDEKLLDNQDLAFLLKVSYRTLQRYRSSKKLPFFMIGHKSGTISSNRSTDATYFLNITKIEIT